MNNLTWFGKLVKFSPKLALFTSRTVLILLFVVLAPIDVVWCTIKHFWKALKSTKKSVTKNLAAFSDEWKATRKEVEYWEDRNE